MNSTPHTHQIVVKRRYNSAGGPVEVTYGDTTVSTLGLLGRFFVPTRDNNPPPDRIRWAAAEAIRRHDRASIRAGTATTSLQSIEEELNQSITAATGWASGVAE